MSLPYLFERGSIRLILISLVSSCLAESLWLVSLQSDFSISASVPPSRGETVIQSPSTGENLAAVHQLRSTCKDRIVRVCDFVFSVYLLYCVFNLLNMCMCVCMLHFLIYTPAGHTGPLSLSRLSKKVIRPTHYVKNIREMVYLSFHGSFHSTESSTFQSF